MRGEGLAAHPLPGIDEAVAAAVHVGVVDLRGIADEHELRAARHAGDHGLRLQRRELLRFIEHKETIRDGAPADVTQRLDLDDALLDEVIVGRGGCPGFRLGERTRPLFFLAAGGRGFGGGAHEQVQRVIDRLQPRPHLFLQAAGQEADSLPHRHDGTAHGHAVERVIHHLMQPRRHRQQGLARAGLAVAGDEADLRVQQRVQQAGLAEIHRLDGAAIAGAQGFRDEWQPRQLARRVHLRGHRRFFTRHQQRVFIHHHAGGARLGQPQHAGAGEALHLVRADLQAHDVEIRHLARLHLVVQVVLAVDAHSARLELHVEILGDQRHLVSQLLPQPQRAGQDAVVHLVQPRKNTAKLQHARRPRGPRRIINHHAHGAAAGRHRPPRHGRAVRAEDLHQRAMHLARVRAALGHLVLKTVQLAEHVHRDAHLVLGEAVDAGRVVQQHVRVQHKGPQPGAAAGPGWRGAAFFPAGMGLLAGGGQGFDAGKLLGRNEGGGGQRGMIVAIHEGAVGGVGGEERRLAAPVEPSFLRPWLDQGDQTAFVIIRVNHSSSDFAQKIRQWQEIC